MKIVVASQNPVKIGATREAFAWMAVKGTTGEISEARSTTLPLPPAIKELVESGMELGEANDKVFATINSKQGGGAFGLLTDASVMTLTGYRSSAPASVIASISSSRLLMRRNSWRNSWRASAWLAASSPL